MILAAALLIDAALGEPGWLWRRVPHPAVAMGRAVEALDRRLNRGDARRAKGAAAVAVLVAGAGATGWILSGGGPVIEAVVAAILLAQRSLSNHVRAVATGLRADLESGRAAVARIVGRDTAAMDAHDVARGAIESAAENLGDGVVAPAFWFAIAGLPGLLAYKVVNTADSTIGYRTPRHAAFGWAAARLDDAMNWIPARLTAGAILLLHATPPGATARDAGQHRSPNAGWPEAAMARVLGVALSGPRSYDGAMRDLPWVNRNERRDAGPADIDRAVWVLWRVWAALLGLSLMGALLG